MSAFKDMLADDLNTFINPDEFADEHTINGEVYTCVVQSPTDREIFLQGQVYDGYDGLHGKKTIIHVKKDVLPEIPPEGQPLNLDGEIYLVAQVVDDIGLLSIVLQAQAR